MKVTEEQTRLIWTLKLCLYVLEILFIYLQQGTLNISDIMSFPTDNPCLKISAVCKHHLGAICGLWAFLKLTI